MRKGTRRYVAWLCVFCMLLTSIPYSVLSDNAPATPTDLQPDAAEVTEEDGIRNIDAPAAEPAEQEACGWGKRRGRGKTEGEPGADHRE